MRSRSALVSALLLAGCAASAPPTPTASGGPSPSPTASPTASGASGAEESTFDLFAWVEESNTSPEAVATALGVVAGEIPAHEAFGRSVYLHAVGPVAVRAERMLADGAFSPALRVDVERRLRKLNPPQDILDQISRRVDEPLFQKISAWSDADLCRDIWRDGFPRGTSYADLECFLFDSFPEGTDQYRIYAPIEFRDSPTLLGMMRAIADAVVRSDAFFSRLDRQRPVRIVFSPAPASAGGMPASVLAHVPGVVPAGYCPITVWSSAAGLERDELQQTVSHELFHCLQEDASGLGALEDGAYSDAKWWVEGTAEYFSNVVYPRVNYEHRWIRDFGSNIYNAGLHKMRYESYLFFQYLEQALGSPGGVYEFLNRLSTRRGEAAQIAALSAQPGIDRLFHGFAETYADDQIMDTGRAPIPITRFDTIDIDATSSERLNNRPFIFKYFRATYDEGDKVDVRTERDREGAPGTLSTRPTNSVGADFWAPTVGEASDGCEETERLWLVTSTASSPSREAIFAYEPTVEEAGDCEEEEEEPPVLACGPVPECLVGTWEPDFDTIFSEENLAEMFPSDRGPALRYEGKSGQVRLRITSDGALTYTYDGLVVRMSSNTTSGRVQTRLALDGTSAAQACDADGRLQFSPRASNVETNVAVTIPGIGDIDGPMDLNDVFSSAEQGTASYTCNRSRMRLTISGPPDAAGESLTMFRDATYIRR